MFSIDGIALPPRFGKARKREMSKRPWLRSSLVPSHWPATVSAGLSVSVHLPNIPIGCSEAAASPAANALHQIDNAGAHWKATPQPFRVEPARMAAMSTGHLNIVPGMKIADPYADPSFGKGYDVPVMFHSGMLGLVRNQRLSTFLHGRIERVGVIPESMRMTERVRSAAPCPECADHR